MKLELRDDVCAALRPVLADLAAGAPRTRAAERARAHAAECPRCAAYLAELEALGSALDATGLPAPPTDLWAAIGPRLEPRRRLAWAPRLGYAAGLAAAAAVAMLVLTQRPAAPPQTPVRVASALVSTAAYDVIPASEMADDGAVFAAYAQTAGRAGWLGPETAAAYLEGDGGDRAR